METISKVTNSWVTKFASVVLCISLSFPVLQCMEGDESSEHEIFEEFEPGQINQTSSSSSSSAAQSEQVFADEQDIAFDEEDNEQELPSEISKLHQAGIKKRKTKKRRKKVESNKREKTETIYSCSNPGCGFTSKRSNDIKRHERSRKHMVRSLAPIMPLSSSASIPGADTMQQLLSDVQAQALALVSLSSSSSSSSSVTDTPSIVQNTTPSLLVDMSSFVQLNQLANQEAARAQELEKQIYQVGEKIMFKCIHPGCNKIYIRKADFNKHVEKHKQNDQLISSSSQTTSSSVQALESEESQKRESEDSTVGHTLKKRKNAQPKE